MPGTIITARRRVVVREIPYPASSLEVFKHVVNKASLSVQRYPDCFFLDSALLKDCSEPFTCHSERSEESRPVAQDKLCESNDISRYSFIGYQPFLTLKAKGSRIEIQTNYDTIEKHANPFAVLKNLLKRFRLVLERSEGLETDNLPVPFPGGAVGYLAYDLCHFIEKLPAAKLDDVGFPDMYFGFYDTIIAFDHMLDKCYVIAVDFDEDCLPYIQENHPPAQERIDQIESRIKSCRGDQPVASTLTQTGGMDHVMPTWHGKLVCPCSSNFTPQEYMEMVRRAKEYIAAGDIYQVNLSQRFKTQISIPPHELYLRLREINPAPFACYLQFDNMTIASSSPERFLRVSNGRVQTRPIKGTRPRWNDDKINLQMKHELLSSPKENAELTMIVDLERNDLGRVCNYGSVKVVQKKVLESYPSVYHLVATVEGDLHPRYDIVDLIKATFPGGSITGVPKIRAMQIIDELEPTRRGVYTGAIGYIGFNDCIDLNIAIRTFLLKQGGMDKLVCPWEAYFQVGGGIVADSDAEKEYEETLHKGRALTACIQQS